MSMTPSERTDVVVVGAGITGLVAAQLLRRSGHSVVVVDPAPPGGRARSSTRGGAVWNLGPHAFFLGGSADRVMGELGVSWIGQPPGALHLSNGDRVGIGPSGVGSLVTTPFLGARGRVAVGTFYARLERQRAALAVGRSFGEWLGSLGMPTDAAAFVAAVARLSTYVHASDLVDAGMMVSQMQQSRRHGVRYLDGGWQTLVDQLVHGLDLRTAAATGVCADAGSVAVTLPEGVLSARAAIVAVASPTAASALTGVAYTAGPPVEAACLDLVTSRPATTPLLLATDEPCYLSDHGVRARLAPQGHSVVHVARYLTPEEHHDPAATRVGLEAHAARAGLDPGAILDARYLHRMTVVGALPMAAHGGLAGRPEHSGVEGVFLAGDWVGPTGHLLDAAVASAEVAARRAARVAAR